MSCVLTIYVRESVQVVSHYVNNSFLNFEHIGYICFPNFCGKLALLFYRYFCVSNFGFYMIL
jgi:hypothetical protein